jgi:oligoendopeptidase F
MVAVAAEYTAQMMQFLLAIYQSPLREAFEEEDDDGDLFADIADPAVDTAALDMKEYELQMSHIMTMLTETIEYEGEEYTAWDCRALKAVDPERGNEAFMLWFDAYQKQMVEAYIGLIKVRQERAQAFGFDNYFQYQFASKHYGMEDVKKYISDIGANIIPLSNALADYELDFTMDFEGFMSFLREGFAKYYPDFIPALDFMDQYGLIDYGLSPVKEQGAFVNHVPGYDAPFMMIQYDDTESGMLYFEHEFGHFYDIYTSNYAKYEDMDITETFSEAMQLLVSGLYVEKFDAETAAALRERTLRYVLDFYDSSYYTAIETEIFSADPDTLTVEGLNALALKLEREFGRSPDESDEYLSQAWVLQSALINQSFYSLSYSVAADIAMQIWETSLADKQKALDLYNKLLEGKDMRLDENLKAAGLADPFSPGRAEKVAGLLRQNLMLTTAPAPTAEPEPEPPAQPPASEPTPTPETPADSASPETENSRSWSFSANIPNIAIVAGIVIILVIIVVLATKKKK